ncbi:hypothetical protein TcCL_ESM09211, partial [Trypanosoma cruzi]
KGPSDNDAAPRSLRALFALCCACVCATAQEEGSTMLLFEGCWGRPEEEYDYHYHYYYDYHDYHYYNYYDHNYLQGAQEHDHNYYYDYYFLQGAQEHDHNYLQGTDS